MVFLVHYEANNWDLEQTYRNDGKYNEEDMKDDIYLVIYMTKVTTVTVG